VGAETYQFEMLPGFIPFRRDIQFITEAKPVDIRPLLQELSFIKDKSKWGYSFRYGHLEMTEADFNLIAEQMLGYIPKPTLSHALKIA